MNNLIKLDTPISEEDVRKLKVGEVVSLSGTIFTGRDNVHRWLAKEAGSEVKGRLDGGVIYHCGPIVAREGEGWRVVSAGPTTSARMEPYMSDVIRECGVRAVVGKGGMGGKTLKALTDEGCVYLQAAGGAGALLASRIKEVRGVEKLSEYGAPEAMWALDVEGFPAVVSMDAHGESLHEKILRGSMNALRDLMQ